VTDLSESTTRTHTADDPIGGRYRLLELIGAGGMGRVWRARDELLLRDVAIKEMRDASPAWHDQAIREARAAARLDHPGVVQVFDVVWHDDRSWIVMEYVRSRSLHQVVRTGGPLPPREVARIGAQVLSALRAAHAAGVLHRDVKPHNILIGMDGRVVLGDFGLATIGATGGGRPDGPDPLLGSPLFVAPERLRLAESGAPADLFSLGATLYDAVEGRPPFARSGTGDSLLALLEEPPDPPRRAGPLGALILDLLAKDPAQRPDAAGTETRLREVAAGDQRIPRRRAPSDGPWRGSAPVPPAPDPDPALPTSPRDPSLRRQVVAVAAGLLAGGVAVAADAGPIGGGLAVLAALGGVALAGRRLS
jgi:eukaryotic-like serine/threonine-protein kinase